MTGPISNVDSNTIQPYGKGIVRGLNTETATIEDCQKALEILGAGILKSHGYVHLKEIPQKGYALEFKTRDYDSKSAGNLLRALYDRMPDQTNIDIKGDVLYTPQLNQLAHACNALASSTDVVHINDHKNRENGPMLDQISKIQAGKTR